MAEVAFVRLAEVVGRKQDMRVVSVTVKPTIADCSGTIYFTDLMLQEGLALTGYTPHTEPFLKKLRVDGEVKAPVWFNGVVRGEETVILFNLGETSAGLDVHIYPKSDMDGASIGLAQGVGGQKVSFPNAVPAEADLALLASTRQCTKNGSPEKKEGFYQYSAAWDSKHKVALPEGKTARVLFEMQEMQDGGEPI